jgi:hypothetical protein
MATNPMAQLLRRKKEIQRLLVALEKELKDIEKAEKSVFDLAAKLAPASDDKSDEGGDGGPSRNRSGARPAQIVKAAKDILLNAPHPMLRGELLDRLAADGVEIVGANPANTLGTTLSRAPNVFVNLRGFGYWLRVRVYSPAGYHPANAEGETTKQESDQPTLLHH